MRSKWKRKHIPLAVRPGPTRFTCSSTGGSLLALPSSVFSPFGLLSPSSQVSRGALGLLRYDGSGRVHRGHADVLVSFSLMLRLFSGIVSRLQEISWQDFWRSHAGVGARLGDQ